MGRGSCQAKGGDDLQTWSASYKPSGPQQSEMEAKAKHTSSGLWQVACCTAAGHCPSLASPATSAGSFLVCCGTCFLWSRDQSSGAATYCPWCSHWQEAEQEVEAPRTPHSCPLLSTLSATTALESSTHSHGFGQPCHGSSHQNHLSGAWCPTVTGCMTCLTCSPGELVPLGAWLGGRRTPAMSAPPLSCSHSFSQGPLLSKPCSHPGFTVANTCSSSSFSCSPC